MASRYDAIVIGAGLNGLTAAAMLAEAGRRVLVIDARDTPGGSATSEESAAGFTIEPVADGVGWLSPRLVSELALDRRGVRAPAGGVFSGKPRVDWEPFVLWRHQPRTLAALEERSSRDAQRWPAFAERMARLAGFLGWLYHRLPPRPVGGGLGGVLELAAVARRARALGRVDMVELARVVPMPIADVLNDAFQCEALKSIIGAGGVAGIQQGPRSAGTTFVLLHHHVGAEAGAFRMRQRVRGGSRAVVDAITAILRAKGAEVRLATRVKAIRVSRGRATGVVLDGGDEIAASNVLSSADACTTLVDLAGPAELYSELVRALQHIRSRGVVARIHLALDALPHFRGLPHDALRGVISLAPGLDGIERVYDDARYGGASSRPVLEARIPSLEDPPSLAPPGKHVMSISVQYAPYRLRNGVWDGARRDALGDDVLKVLAEYAPDLPGVVRHRLVLTLADLAERFALPEGQLRACGARPRSGTVHATPRSVRSLSDAYRWPVPVRRKRASGSRVGGRSWSSGGSGSAQGPLGGRVVFTELGLSRARSWPKETWHCAAQFCGKIIPDPLVQLLFSPGFVLVMTATFRALCCLPILALAPAACYEPRAVLERRLERSFKVAPGSIVRVVLGGGSVTTATGPAGTVHVVLRQVAYTTEGERAAESCLEGLNVSAVQEGDDVTLIARRKRMADWSWRLNHVRLMATVTVPADVRLALETSGGRIGIQGDRSGGGPRRDERWRHRCRWRPRPVRVEHLGRQHQGGACSRPVAGRNQWRQRLG